MNSTDLTHVAFPAFERLKHSTLCPFASGALVESAPMWDALRSPTENLEIVAESLVGFCTAAEESRLHGFVVQVGGESSSFEGVRLLFRWFVEELSRLDPGKSKCMEEDKFRRDWQFEFARVRLFLNVFAACYPQKHSKYCSDLENIYIFFQPEFSFDFCGISSARVREKQRIRKAFADAEMPYSGDMIDGRVEALLYMFPLSAGDPPVVWWRP